MSAERNPQDHGVDRLVADIAERLYGRRPRVCKLHSQTNYCALLSFAEGASDRVIKLARHNAPAIEAEIELYPRMLRRGLPVPVIEYTHADHPSDVPPFMIMLL